MGASILLLDDDASFRALVVPPLTERGHRVVEAGDCAAASRHLAEGPFDLLIVDGQLPDQDGRDWIVALRSSGNRTPIVFVTGSWNDFDTYRRMVDELGVAAVAYKPVIPVAFADAIQGLIGKLNAPAEDLSTDLDAELQALRVAYARELPGKIAALRAALASLRQAPNDDASLKQATSQAHRLRGTAGSYGFDEVSKAAARLEDELRAWNEPGPHDAAAAAGRIDACLEDAQLAVSDTLPSAAPPSQTIPTLRVLVADRRSGLRDQFNALGQSHGVNFVVASSSAQALEEFRRRKTDGAVVDLHLGGQFGGAELAGQLRTAAGDVHLPLLLTAQTYSPDERAAAIHAGAAQLLTGPQTAGTIAAAARRALLQDQSNKPRLLLVDDDPEFAALTRATLEDAGIRVAWTDAPAAVQQILARENPDVLLLDVDLPTISGFDLCRTIRQDPQWLELPILFLTARTDPASRVAAFECGGDDYIPKPVVAVELRARIRARLERSRLLRERGDRDALTGLHLRRRFSESFTTCLSQCSRSQQTLALVLLDLDHFKSINDTHGHLAGDRVLARLGKLLASRFRLEDLRGRWGGEEFILAFPGLSGDTARMVTERALEDLKKISFGVDDGGSFQVSFSGGVAVWPRDGGSQDELVRCADQRLYQAKAAGRGRVVCGDSPPAAEVGRED